MKFKELKEGKIYTYEPDGLRFRIVDGVLYDYSNNEWKYNNFSYNYLMEKEWEEVESLPVNFETAFRDSEYVRLTKEGIDSLRGKNYGELLGYYMRLNNGETIETTKCLSVLSFAFKNTRELEKVLNRKIFICKE